MKTTREQLFLAGPAGKLQAILEQPDAPRGCAVVCHPHPQYGGSMHNKVAHTLARAFVMSGFAALRFNFRGTGASEGEYDNGSGEVDDALAAMHWMRRRAPDKPLWLGGFSFGAAIVIRAAVATPVNGLVSIAPAVSRFAADVAGDDAGSVDMRQPACPWLIVQGDADDIVPAEETIAWVNALAPGPELCIMPQAGHFFHGRLVELRERLLAFIVAHEKAVHAAAANAQLASAKTAD